jgi:hypothetical protein
MVERILPMGWDDSPTWIILAVLYVLFDVVLPMVKKWKARQARRAPAPTPSPAPQPRVRTVQKRPVQPPPSTPRKPSRAVPLQITAPHRILQSVYEPLAQLPQLRPFLTDRDGLKLFAQTSRSPNFPANLVAHHRTIAMRLLREVPGLRADLVTAAKMPTGFSQINSIEELVESSGRLAVGWLETVFADALGLALIGPQYARLRAAEILRAGLQQKLVLNVASANALVLDPPLNVIGPAWLKTMTLLGYRRDLDSLTQQLQVDEDDDPQILLQLDGLGRPVKFDLDAGPAIAITANMFASMLEYAFPQFEQSSFANLSKTGAMVNNNARAKMLAIDVISRHPMVPANDTARLQAAIDLLLDAGSRAAATVLADQAPSLRRRTRAEMDSDSLLAMNAQTIGEAIIMKELLARPARAGRSSLSR